MVRAGVRTGLPSIPGPATSYGPGDEVVVCFPPGHRRLIDGEAGSGVVFEGTVLRRSPTREYLEYRVGVDGTELTLHSRRGRRPSVGQSVRFDVPAEHVEPFPRSTARR